MREVKKKVFVKSRKRYMAKIKRHKCKSFRELKKIGRKYLRYFCKKDWEVMQSISYCAIGEKALRELQQHNDYFSCGIVQEVIDNLGYKATRGCNEYRLIGLEITLEDNYYIFEEVTGVHRVYLSCVGKLSDI